MENFNAEKFLNPEYKYRIKPMMHYVTPKDDPSSLATVLKECGYGGAVINPEYGEDEFLPSTEADVFSAIAKGLKDAGLEYWIYDEKGYPSGMANGFSLKDHPEYEAKGFYMVRRIAYEPRHINFNIDDETDKIVWAAKYPVEIVNVSRSYVQYREMMPVPFSDTTCQCDLLENEALFIFCQKSAYEGSHLTHNVSSHRRYINVMDKKAVRRFIDVLYEAVDQKCPNVFKNAQAVFTDEPSLQVKYGAPYETWFYALAPYCDTLFEEYEKEYGTSILPYLPLIFENGEGYQKVRINFYRLVAKLIAESYSGQISEWCRAHGTVFSGHYLSEESISAQVCAYGDNISVVTAADYPGMDILTCNPEEYNCNSAKYIQMAARKKGTKGMMVELCPFNNKQEFAKDPWNNMHTIVGLLAMSGVRRFNSYFRADLSEIDERYSDIKGYKSKEDCQKLNEYVGRINYMLDGLWNDCNVFVYRAVEDCQAKTLPKTSAALSSDAVSTDGATASLVKFKIFPTGVDFMYLDAADLVEIAENIQSEKPTVSGSEMKILVVPGVDYIDPEAKKTMVKLKNAGVKVLFNNRVTNFVFDDQDVDLSEHFQPTNSDKIIEEIENLEQDFSAKFDGVPLYVTKYDKDGKEMYFIVNNTRGVDAKVTLCHKSKTTATLYNPVDGTITPIMVGDTYCVPSFRSVFVVFD